MKIYKVCITELWKVFQKFSTMENAPTSRKKGSCRLKHTRIYLIFFKRKRSKLVVLIMQFTKDKFNSNFNLNQNVCDLISREN